MHMTDYSEDGYSRASRTGLAALFGRSLARRATRALRYLLLETELFLGAALVAIGLLSFESDKFCDGNTADYLSCTRPSTYYFFDWLDVTLIILGIFLILIWVLKTREGEDR